MTTRRFALASLATGFALALSPSADAGDYPVKAIRLIVPFPPGAGTDMFGRTIAQKLHESMGRPIVVENKPGGEVNVLFETTLTVAPQAKAGKLRPLAVGSLKRSSASPELPTIAESGFPGFSAENWYGMYVSSGTPKQIVDRLNHEIVRALNLPDVRERFASQGADLVGNTPEQHAVFLKSEMDKWQRIARQANVKVD